MRCLHWATTTRKKFNAHHCITTRIIITKIHITTYGKYSNFVLHVCWVCRCCFCACVDNKTLIATIRYVNTSFLCFPVSFWYQQSSYNLVMWLFGLQCNCTFFSHYHSMLEHWLSMVLSTVYSIQISCFCIFNQILSIAVLFVFILDIQ